MGLQRIFEKRYSLRQVGTLFELEMSALKDKKILLVDDELEILDLLEAVLRKEGFRKIYKAGDGSQALKLARELEPDIIVLDIMLPDLDGFEVCRKLREFTYVPIIFLSARDEDVDKLLGLGMGGDDYLTKPFSPKEVAFRLKAHFRRQEYWSSLERTEKKGRWSFGDIEIDEERGEVKKGGQRVNLTAKEYSLLLYLAQNAGKILSKNKLLEKSGGRILLAMTTP